MTNYLDFIPTINERSHIKTFIENDAGIQQQESKLMGVFAAWWQIHAPDLGELYKTKKLTELRADFFSSFVDSLVPVGLLDRFKVAGVVASWWNEVQYELKILLESDFGGLIDSWVDSIKDALEQDDDEKKSKPVFDPLNHKLVLRLLSDYLAEIATVEANIAELEQQKEAFEAGEDGGEETEDGGDEEGETVNFVKSLETRLKVLKNEIKEPKKELKVFKKSPLLNPEQIVDLEELIRVREGEIKEIELQLQPYQEIKKQLTEAKTKLRVLKNDLVKRLEEKRKQLMVGECQDLVLGIFHDGLIVELERYVTAHRQMVIAVVENWWDKYRVNLRDIEAERDEAVKELNGFLQDLGYV
jgi:hypothetical protein